MQSNYISHIWFGDNNHVLLLYSFGLSHECVLVVCILVFNTLEDSYSISAYLCTRQLVWISNGSNGVSIAMEIFQYKCISWSIVEFVCGKSGANYFILCILHIFVWNVQMSILAYVEDFIRIEIPNWFWFVLFGPNTVDYIKMIFNARTYTRSVRANAIAVEICRLKLRCSQAYQVSSKRNPNII